MPAVTPPWVPPEAPIATPIPVDATVPSALLRISKSLSMGALVSTNLVLMGQDVCPMSRELKCSDTAAKPFVLEIFSTIPSRRLPLGIATDPFTITCSVTNARTPSPGFVDPVKRFFNAAWIAVPSGTTSRIVDVGKNSDAVVEAFARENSCTATKERMAIAMYETTPLIDDSKTD